MAQTAADLPSINDMLSTLIRLMSNFASSPHEHQVMTLVKMLEQVRKHPDYESNQAVRVAIEQATVIWVGKMNESKPRHPCVLANQQGSILLH